ncbi:MAG: NusG domain II-containing protein [Gammaproteobacteria bacterium]
MLKAGDVIVLVLASALIGASFATFWSSREAGHTAIISFDEDILIEAPLDTPADYSVSGLKGVSRLRVAKGQIRFIDSPCQGRYCIHTGWLSSTGQVAACLPNGIVVEVLGGERLYDAINL